jgi:hypothetical protein
MLLKHYLSYHKGKTNIENWSGGRTKFSMGMHRYMTAIVMTSELTWPI